LVLPALAVACPLSRHDAALAVAPAASELKQPIQQANPISGRQSEAGGKGRDLVGNHARIVEDAFDYLDGDSRHCGGLNVVGEQVRKHPRGPGHGQAAQHDTVLLRNDAPMDAHVRPSRLAAAGRSELMDVRTKVADLVQRCCRRVRYHGDVGVVEPLPCGFAGVELKPSGPEREVVGLACAPDAVDATRHSFG